MSSDNWRQYLLNKKLDISPSEISHLLPEVMDMLDESQTTYIEADIPFASIPHQDLAKQNPAWFREMVIINELLIQYDLKQVQGQDKAQDHLDQIYYYAIYSGSTLDQYAPDNQHICKEVALQLYRGKPVAISEAKVVLLEYVQWLYYALLTSYYHLYDLELIENWESTAQNVFELAGEHNDSTMESLCLQQFDAIDQLLHSRSLKDTVRHNPDTNISREARPYILHRKLLSFGNFVTNTRQLDNDNPVYTPSVLA